MTGASPVSSGGAIRSPRGTCDDCGHINVQPGGSHRLRKVRQHTSDPGGGRAGHLVLLRPVALLHPGLAGARPPDLDYCYPTSVMVTGYDIIFFWVARMIFSGCEQMKKIPFHTVLIHGLVRDDKGRKMSKSLGNGIDPLEMAEKYGADALRFNLITGNSPGNDTRFYTEKCEAMRNFANKIWNASRFVMMNLHHRPGTTLPAADKLEREDKWVLSKLNTAGEGGHRESGQLRDRCGLRQGLRLHLGHLLRLVYRADQDPPERRRTRTPSWRHRTCCAMC